MFLLDLYFFEKRLIWSICKIYYFENQKRLLHKILKILQNNFAVNKIRFTICEVRSKNSFPTISKKLRPFKVHSQV